MPSDTLASPEPAKSTKSRPYRKRALTQLIELQERAYRIGLNATIKESVACFAMRSWCSLQEERRKLSMKPLPKPIDVTQVMRKARVKQLAKSWSEPTVSQSASQPEPDKPQAADGR